MIDIRTHVIGGQEIAELLRRAPNAIRSRLTARLAEIGDRIVADAKAAVPVGQKHKSAAMRLRDAIHFRVFPIGEGLKLHVSPYDKGQYLPHIIERGVQRQEIRVYKKVFAAPEVYQTKTGKWRLRGKRRVRKGNFLYTRSHHIDKRPYFGPAMQRAGDVGAALQDAVSQAAEDVSAGAR